MERELEQALRTAREWAADAKDAGRLALMARVFLATHERLGEVERELDAWKDAKRQADDRAVERVVAMRERAEKAERELLAAESRLADAERRGAREALTRYVIAEETKQKMAQSSASASLHQGRAMSVAAFRDREYPAPSPVGGERCQHGRCERAATRDDCRAECLRPATPQAAPEPPLCLDVLATGYFKGQPRDEGTGHFLRITPDIAKRIVALAQTTEG